MAKKSVPVSAFIHTTHLWVQNWIFSMLQVAKKEIYIDITERFDGKCVKKCL